MTVHVGPGMSPVPRRLADTIRKGRYTDSADLPPARPDRGGGGKL